MKVTFISVFPDLTAFGLRTIASYINKEGVETQIIFLPDQDFDTIMSSEERSNYLYPDTVMEQIEKLCKDSDLVGFSVFSCYFRQAVQLSCRIQQLKIPVLWGGKHPSARPEESLKYADMVCIGEGEEAMLELVNKMERGKDFFDTQNLWFSKSKGVVKNSLRPLMEDIDRLPLFSYTFCPHLVWLKESESIEPLDEEILKRFFISDPFSRGGRVYQTMTSRGCPFSCSYCYTFKNLYKGQQYVRHRSVNNIILELEKIKNTYNFITHVSICDDEFLSVKLDRIKDFSIEFKERVGLSLSCLASPLNTTEEKLDYLINAGLCAIQVGIQTGSRQGKKAYNRNISDKKNISAVKVINQYKDKLFPFYDFIIDNPYETTEDALETLRFILKIPKPYRLNIFSLVFFPGTQLYLKALNDGFIIQSEETYSKVYRDHKERYLNLIFHLFNYPFPKPIIRMLISKPMVFIFERKIVNRTLFSFLDVLRNTKILFFLKHRRTLKPNLKTFKI